MCVCFSVVDYDNFLCVHYVCLPGVSIHCVLQFDQLSLHNLVCHLCARRSCNKL